MNVYDFDNTIYNGDCTIDFCLYCLKKDIKLLRFIPEQVWGFVLYLLGRIDKTKLKEKFFIFLKGIDKKDEYINCFWRRHKKKIKKWYLENKKENDVIISASPEFLIRPILENIGIKNLIATVLDINTGKINGKNCHSREKVIRFKEKYANENIQQFYSDSMSDTPLAELAEEAYFVKKNKIIPWSKAKTLSPFNIKSVLSAQFMRFVIVGIINSINGVFFASIYSMYMDANCAFVIGYITSLIISYILNAYFVFKSYLSIVRFIKFCISYIPNFIIQNIVVFVLYNVLSFPKLYAYVLAVALACPVTYLVMRFFAFSKK